jgi:hypothetical protein
MKKIGIFIYFILIVLGLNAKNDLKLRFVPISEYTKYGYKRVAVVYEKKVPGTTYHELIIIDTIMVGEELTDKQLEKCYLHGISIISDSIYYTERGELSLDQSLKYTAKYVININKTIKIHYISINHSDQYFNWENFKLWGAIVFMFIIIICIAVEPSINKLTGN